MITCSPKKERCARMDVMRLLAFGFRKVVIVLCAFVQVVGPLQLKPSLITATLHLLRKN